MSERRDWPDAGEVAARLNARIAVLAPELLPAGRRKGGYWTCSGVDNLPGHSLFIHLHGGRAGRWQDAATGEFGDALDLLAAVRHGGDRKAAYRAALAYLGLAEGIAATPVQPAAPVARHAGPSDEDERKRRYAHRLWLEAQPTLAGTPGAAYLAARGIDLSELRRQPRALRFHPALPHNESRRNFPAIVAAVHDAAGTHVATHRIYIERHGHRWGKANVENPKLAIGNFAGASIRIWRGASNKPLRDAPEGEPVVIGEGIETCLSITVAVPELRVLCAISLGNLGSVALPPQISQVILASDNDASPAARRQFQRAVERHLDAGRHVRVARAEIGKDFNDTLTAWATAPQGSGGAAVGMALEGA